MSDIAREKVAEAMRGMPSPIAAEQFEPGSWRSCASWEQIIEMVAPLVADAAIAAHLEAIGAGGHVVVALPERGVAGWPVDLDDDDFQVLPVHLVDEKAGAGMTGCRISWGAIELTLSPVHARRLAGALLAVLAATAERGEQP